MDSTDMQVAQFLVGLAERPPANTYPRRYFLVANLP